MWRSLALGMAIVAAATSAQAAVQSKPINYKVGDLECKGVLYWDDAVTGARPGVLVFHEWWGLDAYAKRRAEMLAKLGYVAFAADMYGEGKVVTHPMDAREMVTKVRMNTEEWRKRGLAALDVLTSQPQCDKTKVAAIGYCFGGSTCQLLAFSGADLKAIASFHGGLVQPSPEQVKAVKGEMLIFNGADDKFISEDSIKSFRASLDKEHAKYEFVNYPGTVHSFTVAEADSHGIEGMKYNKEADEKSWAETQKVFKEKLGK